MSATTQHLIGQLADGRFPLRKLLGVSPNSAVFLTSLEVADSGDRPLDAAIKLIPEDPENSDTQLDRWQAASTLSHAGLLRILHCGRCTIDGSPCLYFVSELADEDLGQLLPRRALTTDETRGMLAAVLPTLDFLHENGLVHGGVKPSNIHATGDNVKLSADRIVSAGESSSAWPLAEPFAAPESVLFPASDIWSLGVSLCETLTKNLPTRDPSGKFSLPDLPAPFAEIVRSALVEDATLRITLDEVRSLLDPAFIVRRESVSASHAEANSAGATTEELAKEHAREYENLNEPANSESGSSVGDSPYIRPPDSPGSPESLIAAIDAPRSNQDATQHEPLPEIDPLAVPLSPVSPPSRSPTGRSSGMSNVTPPAQRSRIPVSSLPQVNASIGGPRRVSNPPPSTMRANKLFLVSIAAAIILLGLFIPRYFLRSRNESSQNSASPTASAPSTTASGSKNSQVPTAKTSPSISAPSPSASTNSPAASATPPPKSSPVPNPSPSTPNGNPRSSAVNPLPSTAASQPASRSSQPATSNANSMSPTVVRKVLPDVSEKSRSTIRGTVRINVRVQINPDGTVSTAELAAPAPSQFFAAAALKAARQWQFTPPASSDPTGTAASVTIRFDFTPTSTTAELP